MDNQTRSELSRKRAIEAALAILATDGVGALTFDNLSRESGISRGGLLHQFRSKDGILRALLEYQREEFAEIARKFLRAGGAECSEPTLAAQITIYRKAANQSHSVARALLAAIVETPHLIEEIQGPNFAVVEKIEEEAEDVDLALLRYFAASGLAFNALLGVAPISKEAERRLFERLLNDEAWESNVKKRMTRASAKT